MGAKVWYVAAGKKKAGPMTSGRLRQQLDVGKLPDGALAWRDGMEAWEPVAEIEHFQSAPAEASAVEEAPEAMAPKARTKTKTSSTKRKSRSGVSASGERKVTRKSGTKRTARKAETGAAGFTPPYRLEWKHMFLAFGRGLELERVKLALMGFSLPALALVLLGGVGVLAAKLHVLLALPCMGLGALAAYVLTTVAVGALSYHARFQILEQEPPRAQEALRHALSQAASLSVPPFVLSLAWLVPLVLLGILALVVKIPYVGPVGTGLLFGVHLALGALTLFLVVAAGVAAAFGPVAAAFEGAGIKDTLGLVLGFAKRSLVRALAWGALPNLGISALAQVLCLIAALVVALPLAAVFASVGPETLEWLQAGGMGDAPYPGAMLMLIFMGLWIGFVGVVVCAILASVHNALLSLLYAAGRPGNDSLISRDTYLARCAEGAE
ncbi:MAG: DUF4339 domain-containing protein [Planctomycetota bacterium]